MGSNVNGRHAGVMSATDLLCIVRPNFAFCGFSASEAEGCLQAIQRLIVVGNWLAKTARVELTRFREFMGWLRYGERNYGSNRNGYLIKHW